MFDIIPMELVFGVMWWMEVGETDVRLVEAMYSEPTAAMGLDGDMPEQLGVEVSRTIV